MNAIFYVLLLGSFFLNASLASAEVWGHPVLVIARDDVQVVWQDEHGRRVDAPHGAGGRLVVTNHERVVTEYELRYVPLAKWQPLPPFLSARTRLGPLGCYPWRLRLELRWTFQRGGPEVLEYELLAPGFQPRLLRSRGFAIT